MTPIRAEDCESGMLLNRHAEFLESSQGVDPDSDQAVGRRGLKAAVGRERHVGDDHMEAALIEQLAVGDGPETGYPVLPSG